jgi:hypothetical protein
LRLIGPLLALLLSAGGLLFGFHSQRASRALSAGLFTPAATTPAATTPPATTPPTTTPAATAPLLAAPSLGPPVAPTGPALKLVPRALHLADDPPGLRLPPPPAQKRPIKARHHDRQARTHSGGV